ncbi:MAG: Na+/H+ antiporter subunit E [Deltaproteobacteria bacterium]|nr:Na+/H+ antiporter subunit E [Deltaproteobacteria bacterium]
MRRWIPQPLFSLFLWLVWLLLANSTAPGQMVLGGFLALILPLFTARFWPDRPCIRRPLVLTAYLLVFFWDIVVANLTVARLILGSPKRLRPAFVRLPLDLNNDFAVTVLAHTISLTPGTVSSDLSEDRKTLLVHALDVDDEAGMIRRIKTRYEAPLKEIFQC